MSTLLQDNKAWAWYDADTRMLQHVGFNKDTDYGPDLVRIEMHYDSALDIANGKSRLFEYEVIDVDGEPSIVYKKQAPPFRKFWQLVDPTQSQFGSNFSSVDGSASPVSVTAQDENGFEVDVRAKARNIVFYITMKNDPNYLISKIDLYPHAADTGDVKNIRVPVDIKGDYSIYVRYDAA